MMPVLAEHVKVEAGFASFSTLLVLSIPAAIWGYIPDHLAIAVIGLIKSNDLVSDNPASADQTISKTWLNSSEAGPKQPTFQMDFSKVIADYYQTKILVPKGNLGHYCHILYSKYRQN